jgi:hypothetical protein
MSGGGEGKRLKTSPLLFSGGALNGIAAAASSRKFQCQWAGTWFINETRQQKRRMRGYFKNAISSAVNPDASATHQQDVTLDWKPNDVPVLALARQQQQTAVTECDSTNSFAPA